jgi:DNA-binding NarL/FixJ family response regulator
MIKIALADDHAILRRGVAELISKFDNMSVIMEAGNGKELIAQMNEAPLKKMPDLCVLDINMPEMNGYETASIIHKNWPRIKILALSMYDTEMNIIKMLRNGAHGYVLKDAEPEELKKAINEIYTNGFYHSELLTERVLRLLHPYNSKPNELLTDNETTFLTLCCSEMTYKEIAERMSLSPRTIDGYRENLFLKLDITTRTGLVMYAIRAGLVSPN